jgi:hypothetical protein
MKAYIASARFFSPVGLTNAGARMNNDSATTLAAADEKMAGKYRRRLSEEIPNAVVFVTDDNIYSSLTELQTKVEDGFLWAAHGGYYYPLCAI